MCVACVWHVCGMCVVCVQLVCGLCVARTRTQMDRPLRPAPVWRRHRRSGAVIMNLAGGLLSFVWQVKCTHKKSRGGLCPTRNATGIWLRRGGPQGACAGAA